MRTTKLRRRLTFAKHVSRSQQKRRCLRERSDRVSAFPTGFEYRKAARRAGAEGRQPRTAQPVPQPEKDKAAQ